MSSISDKVGNVVGKILDKVDPVKISSDERKRMDSVFENIPHGKHVENMLRIQEMESRAFANRFESTKSEFTNAGYSDKKATAMSLYFSDYTGDTDSSLMKFFD
jgi:hypothetical protein